LNHKAQGVQSSLWILEHIVCPMLNILFLLVIVSLVYPLVNTGNVDLLRLPRAATGRIV